MGYKLVRTDSVEPHKIKLDCGTHLIGRGKFLECYDKRVSRNHGELNVGEDFINIKALHQNPCFFTKKGVNEIQILRQNCTTNLTNGDKFGLLPDSYWYELIYCALTEEIEQDSLVSEAAHVPESVDNELTEQISYDNVQDITSVENEDEAESPSLLENSQITPKLENHDLNTNNDVVTSKTGHSEVTSPFKRSHSVDCLSSDNDVKKIKVEQDIKQEPEDVKLEISPTQPGPSCKQENSDADKKDNDSAPDSSPSNPPCGPLRERCLYGANCYRRNPQHALEFSHPRDADWGVGDRGVCPWGASCRRRDPRHWRNHEHPPGIVPPPPAPAHPPGHRPGNKQRRKQKRHDDSDETSPESNLILTGKRSRKTVVRASWCGSESGEEDPYGTDDSEEWEPPSDCTESQDYTQNTED